MKNGYGKPKKTSNGRKHKSKTKKSKSPNRYKTGKTMPSQPIGSNIDKGTIDQVLSTARQENINTLGANSTITDKPSLEESKIEVIETGDKGSAKILTNNDTLHTVESSNRQNNNNFNKTVSTNPRPNNSNIMASSNPVIEFDTKNNNFSLDQSRIANEMVPPIQNIRAKVFSSPEMNILAKSRRIKKKKRRVITTGLRQNKDIKSTTGMLSAFPGRKVNVRKTGYSRGLSINSNRSLRSRRKYKSASRSSRSKSSRASSTGRKYKSNVRKMKKKYIRNVLPHVHSHEDKQMIAKQFTNPS
jgi:hypothetical protein